MANISDLQHLKAKPKTINGWLSSFPADDQIVIIKSVLDNGVAVVYPVLRELDENPFPFTRSALVKYAREMREK